MIRRIDCIDSVTLLIFGLDLLEETEPTQTPYEKRSDPINKVTESIQSILLINMSYLSYLRSNWAILLFWIVPDLARCVSSFLLINLIYFLILYLPVIIWILWFTWEYLILQSMKRLHMYMPMLILLHALRKIYFVSFHILAVTSVFILWLAVDYAVSVLAVVRRYVG